MRSPRPRSGVQLPSRRRFLGGGAAAGAAILFGPSVLAACGSSDTTAATSSSTPDDGTAATGTLRVSNWPLFIAPDTVAQFQSATGLVVDYKEDYNDDEQWFAKNKEPLSRRQDIGADLVVPSEVIATRLMGLGWLNEIRHARVPNLQNLRPDLLNSSADPGRKFTAPYMNSITGLAYNAKATGRPITSVDDLWDPAFKGRVTMFSDTLDALGMVMFAQGNTPAEPTTESVQRAADFVRTQKDKGQIRSFTGNDYVTDLASGNVAISQAYSGDVVQLQADNPDLKFVVPEAGGTLTLTDMVIPYTTQNQAAAEEWIDYTYDRANYAKLVAYIQYIPVLSDMTDDLARIDPALADDPLINPPPEILAKVKQWPLLTDEQTQEFNAIYSAVTGG
ncbi:polyamine ABC transporter substrate-binding protein [Mycolicibacterium sediminis]|uniref:polyamine ABC transporter substrate-binding protein n=1 Tax=Mycolicibacterium sediminis TaxID=1286180 RepID=UPI001FE47D32|nr:spermidine/putrescine ABC transporter substrate-binding protein [Mycolicibacterium sediminis]